MEIEGVSYIRAEYAKREFISMAARLQWIWTVFYTYLSQNFNKDQLAFAIGIADKSLHGKVVSAENSN